MKLLVKLLGRFVERAPFVAALARVVASVAAYRIGRLPLGLLTLLPVALLLDFADVFDELLPVVGPLAMFFLETAFVLGLTGQPAWALPIAGLDLIPFVDVIPFATLAILSRLAKALRPAPAGPDAPAGTRVRAADRP